MPFTALLLMILVIQGQGESVYLYTFKSVPLVVALHGPPAEFCIAADTPAYENRNAHI